MTAATAEVRPDVGPAEVEGLSTLMGLLARVGNMDSRPSGIPSDPIHLGYAEAAERLNLPEKWLRERITSLPHRKFGKLVKFTEEDIRAISDMHFVQPGAKYATASESAEAPIRPSGRSRKRS
ncbi:helix-turn-helix domain-containing protein [Streptomyces sp. 891-h]|uniref:helix-turn-helix domain-containing protein n=1 Tax=Streptomyces sp. 891-h TaxID=2720714 RepID=UPI001FA9E8C5|nr:helix-turn-helix domain-containing protein [Streptomyces sp. 891-h]UNZ18167.1 helix-turn-helix domain-containing protein [Streptomyces sp. 891-h]